VRAAVRLGVGPGGPRRVDPPPAGARPSGRAPAAIFPDFSRGCLGNIQGAAAEPKHVPGTRHLPQEPLRQPQRRTWADWHRDRVLARCSGASGVRPPDATTTSSWLRSISPTFPHSTPTLPSRVSGVTTLAGGISPRTSTQKWSGAPQGRHNLSRGRKPPDQPTKSPRAPQGRHTPATRNPFQPSPHRVIAPTIAHHPHLPRSSARRAARL